MKKYEIMYIVKTTLENDSINSINDEFKNIFTSRKSKIVDFKELGQKQLAYPIKKEINGNYFLMIVEANTDALNEFKRKIAINENVLRHVCINLDEE